MIFLMSRLRMCKNNWNQLTPTHTHTKRDSHIHTYSFHYGPAHGINHSTICGGPFDFPQIMPRTKKYVFKWLKTSLGICRFGSLTQCCKQHSKNICQKFAKKVVKKISPGYGRHREKDRDRDRASGREREAERGNKDGKTTFLFLAIAWKKG